jgi:phosphohistidine phosphatase SixA
MKVLSHSASLLLFNLNVQFPPASIVCLAQEEEEVIQGKLTLAAP